MGKSNSGRKSYVVYAGLGMSLCIEIAAAGLIGWWLGSQADRLWGIKPFGMIGGIIVFFSVAFWHLVRVLRSYDKQTDQEPEDQNGV